MSMSMSIVIYISIHILVTWCQIGHPKITQNDYTCLDPHFGQMASYTLSVETLQ